MKLDIKVIQKGKSFNELVRDIENVRINAIDTTLLLAKECKKKFRENIERNTRVRTGNLASNIVVHRIIKNKKIVEYGIGSIPLLNRRAVYWRILNYGGMAKKRGGGQLKVPGLFDGIYPPSQARFRQDRKFVWMPRGTNTDIKKGLMVVKRPIIGIHYIEKTKSWLKTIVKVRYNRIFKTTKILTKR